MSVRLEAGVVHLASDSPVEDAETLLALLLAHPDAAVDLAAATSLHTAVVQVMLRARPAIAAPSTDPFLAGWIMPFLDGSTRPIPCVSDGASDDDHDPDRR